MSLRKPLQLFVSHGMSSVTAPAETHLKSFDEKLLLAPMVRGYFHFQP